MYELEANTGLAYRCATSHVLFVLSVHRTILINADYFDNINDLLDTGLFVLQNSFKYML